MIHATTYVDIYTLGVFSTTTGFLSLAILLLVVAQGAKRMKFVRGFKDIPGPASIPIFGNALQLTGSQAEFFTLLQECSRKYGSMFLLWVGQRPFVFLYSADAIQPILKSNVFIEKSLEYKLLHPFLGTGLVTSGGSKWHARRKLLTPVFHYDILEDYLQPVLRESSILVSQLQNKAGLPAFDVVPYMKMAALDIICDLTMGYRLNSQMNSNLDYVHAIEELMAIQQRRFITPWLKPDILFNCSPYANKQQKCLNVIHAFSEKVISDKKTEYASMELKLHANENNNEQKLHANENNNEQKLHTNENNNEQKKRGKVFLDLLLELSESGSILSDNEIRDEVNTFIFAGHDTTSTTLSWCLFVLGLHPEAQVKIIQELREKIPNFGEDRIKVSDIVKLEYLECCIKEVLRLFPVVPLIARHITEPLDILDHTFLPGTTVLINAYALHRDPAYFPNPDCFVPDRFSSSSRAENKHPFAYIPFSAGPRNCIGQKLAMLMVKVTLANILKNFKIKTTTPMENLRLVAEVVLNNENGIKVAIETRV